MSYLLLALDKSTLFEEKKQGATGLIIHPDQADDGCVKADIYPNRHFNGDVAKPEWMC